jgi:hypothetical protein
MGWEDILKIDIKTLTDAKRVARDYAPIDLVEGFIVSQEEYDKMSHEDRQKYHTKIYNQYKAVGLQKTPAARWHIRNASRSVNTAILQPHPTEEELNPKEGYRSVLEGTGRNIFGPRRLSTARAVEGFKFGGKRSGRPKGAKDRKPRKSRGPSPFKGKKRSPPKPKPEIRSKPINQIIIDYFTMYNNRFGRNPTLQEIQEDEGRPLTVDEIDSFERYAQSR